MKRRSFRTYINPNGILRWSTLCILAALPGCNNPVATDKDVAMAENQAQIEQLDREQAKLLNGEIPNNFYLPKLGYYHANAKDFFENPYGMERDGKYYIDGMWQDAAVADYEGGPTRPTPEALKKIELALEQEQKAEQEAEQAQNTNNRSSYHGGANLMMYWLIFGNRNTYTPGPGFQQASTRIGVWEQNLASQRSAVASYSAASPGYRSLVAQSRASGTSIHSASGASVRGGFGGSAHGSSAS